MNDVPEYLTNVLDDPEASPSRKEMARRILDHRGPPTHYRRPVPATYSEIVAGRAASLPMIEAADFINGGAPTIARVFDRRGVEIGAFERDEGETLDDFRLRARQSAQEAPGAARVVLGGLRSSGRSAEPGGLPRAAVALSEVPFLHPSQREALALIENNRRVALAAGRRWGKSSLLIALSLDYAIAGRSVGLFAPTFKFLKPLLDDIALALARLPGISINRSMAEIRLRGGGALDFWSLDFTGRAARPQISSLPS